MEFGRNADPTQATQSVDLGLLAGNIGVDALDVSGEADAVVRAVNDLVVHQVQGAAMLQASGLAVYFPPKQGLFDQAYRETFPDSPWLSFLDAYYNAGAAIPAEAQPATTQESADVVSDGKDFANAYVDLAFDDASGHATIDVPMSYYADPSSDAEPMDVTLSIVYDPESGDILQQAYDLYDEAIGSYAQLDVSAAGIVVPLALQVLADGSTSWVPTVDVGLWADIASLQYEFVPIDPSTVLTVALSIQDFGGNIASVHADVEI